MARPVPIFHRSLSRRRGPVLFMALLLVLLTACSGPGILFRSTDELYSLPKASAEYTQLQRVLQEVLSEGLEYAPPVSGSNTQPVRLFDLDGDGMPEAMAFFRDPSADKAQLKIYIFHQNEEGAYQRACVIEGDGSEINSVLLTQLMDDRNSPNELVVSWQMANVSHAVYTLSAYSLDNWQPVELMGPVTYTRYSATDLDGDEEEELVVFHVEPGDTAVSTAEFYDRSGQRMEVTSTANLSMSLSAIEKIRAGQLSDRTPVVYVTGSVLDKSGGSSSQITDVFLMKNGILCNVTLNNETLDSNTTLRSVITGGQDITGDDVLEIPHPYLLPNFDRDSNDSFYAIDWQQYFSDGSYAAMATTYHNAADGWYLELPADWQNKFSMERQDVTSGSTNERGVVFYYARGRKKWQPFLAIYKNTGSNRVQRSAAPGRVQLYADGSTVYSMELLDQDPDITLSESVVKRGFHLIVTDWTAE